MNSKLTKILGSGLFVPWVYAQCQNIVLRLRHTPTHFFSVFIFRFSTAFASPPVMVKL
jgi:hypothetical protein